MNDREMVVVMDGRRRTRRTIIAHAFRSLSLEHRLLV